MEWDIEYNTSNKALMFPEYGRTVQDLLLKANDVPEDDDRQRYVERVIKLMLQMQPSVKQQENYQERLWKHAFKIAGGHLNVTVPESIDVTPDAERPKPEMLAYPELSKRKPHYGQNVIALIEKGMDMEDGPERDLLVYTAAYYMKVALTDWRDGKFYSETMIRKDLKDLSNGKLELPADAKIGEPKGNQPSQDDGLGKRKKKKKNKSKSSQKPRSQRSNNSRSRGRNRRR